jgi:hypothetical protein
LIICTTLSVSIASSKADPLAPTAGAWVSHKSVVGCRCRMITLRFVQLALMPRAAARAAISAGSRWPLGPGKAGESERAQVKSSG